MASQFTEEAVQGFLSERGGRVQQMELMDHFLSHRGCNNDQSDEGVYREVLRRIVDSVCLVKVEDGVKYVCLNAERSAMRSDSGCPDQAECNGNIREALDNKHVNGNPENGVQTGEGRCALDEFLFKNICIFSLCVCVSCDISVVFLPFYFEKPSKFCSTLICTIK